MKKFIAMLATLVGLVGFSMVGNSPAMAQTPIDTTASVSFSDPCGTDNDTIVTGTEVGVTYSTDDQRVAGVGIVVVTASAAPGYEIVGQAVFTQRFTDEPCAPAPDIDGDGIPDATDPDNTDGPKGDADGDGVLNEDDDCAGTSAGATVDANGCEVVVTTTTTTTVTSTTDIDGDGIPDATDPDNTDGPKGDADGDGVLTEDDDCAGTSAGATVDANGCEVVVTTTTPTVATPTPQPTAAPAAPSGGFNPTATAPNTGGSSGAPGLALGLIGLAALAAITGVARARRMS